MPIKAIAFDTVISYEVDGITFYQCFGMPTAITKDFVLKASADGEFSSLVVASETYYNEKIEDCLRYGKEISWDEFEEAAKAVIDNLQSKIAFLKEALTLEGMGALAD